MNIGFIGGGNMATALITGLLESDTPPESIRVSEPNPEARRQLEALGKVRCFDQARPAVEAAEVIVLATKPQVMPAVLGELSGLVNSQQLVLSIAAGITIDRIAAALADNTPVIRAMPNTPALIGKGISGCFASACCQAVHRALAERILSATGAVVWIEHEALMDVVTAVSGSGPAYYFLLTEALCEAGEALGLSPGVAGQLARHTAQGAGAMAATSEQDVAELRRRVTSPGGTTQAALEVFEDGGFRELVRVAVRAATRRGRELAGVEASS